jgi:FkbM family methyltransferase
MVEIDPVNAECIRRNFTKEIEDGRAVLIAEGAWSEESTMDFVTGVSNSGTGSLVLGEEGGSHIQVPVRRIDDMLKQRGIDRIDFVKMDIEGAEREALKGARGTIRSNRPRLMLDAYHRTDDDVVLPALLKQMRPDYQSYCAVCDPSRHNDGRLGPYALYFY